ncbi:MAG: methionyl-tRNA formyltransferase [Patescibacteria group bacterium]
MKEKSRIVFFGTPPFAGKVLQALIEENFNVVACVTKPDSKAGRKLKLSVSAVKKIATENNIPVLQPEKMKDEGFSRQLASLKPEIIIVVAYGKILPASILNLPPFGSLNIHASLLPRYRGASPIQAALLNGDQETGVTIMKMDEQMDTGPILAQEKVGLSPGTGLETLHDALAFVGAKLLIKTLPLYLAGKIIPEPQDNDRASYVKIIKKEDGHLDFSLPAEILARKILALNPWPGTYVIWRDKSLKILEAEINEKNNGRKPGQVTVDKGGLYVAAQDRIMAIKKLQLSGRQQTGARDFILGHPEIKDAVFA